MYLPVRVATVLENRCAQATGRRMGMIKTPLISILESRLASTQELQESLPTKKVVSYYCQMFVLRFYDMVFSRFTTINAIELLCSLVFNVIFMHHLSHFWIFCFAITGKSKLDISIHKKVDNRKLI